MIRKILLGGASCLAILGGAGEASASIAFIDTTPGVSSFTAPTTGSYTVSVWGAQGGAGYAGSGFDFSGATYAGGLGYGQRTVFRLTAGQTVALYVGAKGGDAIVGTPGHFGGGGGGGGASAVVLNPGLGIFAGGVVSGGGGGGAKYNVGYNARGVSSGGAGGAGGRVGGQGGQFGSPGAYGPGLGGGPGGGLRTYTPTGDFAGRGHYDGGGGGVGYAVGGAGGSGFAGGGGSVSLGGGGGGGFSGGGGGGAGGSGATGADRYGGGGGGGSYNFGGTGQTALAYKAGDGEIEISSSVPEPSTWAMMLGGFGFTGYVLRRRVMRRRVMRPA